MKKLCVLLAACLLLCSFFGAIPASAADNGFDIRSGVLVKYTGSATSVTVPDGVTAVGDAAFINNTKITSVTLPTSVRSVGEQAFYGCTSLKSVSGGGNVTEAGDMAFQLTPYLENSTDKYFMLGHVLLWYNGTSTSVSIPTHCTAVASYAFMRCEYLTAFNAYEGLVSVGTGAFYGCTRLKTVNLPSTVSAVGAYAFEGSPYLRELGTFAVAGDGVLLRYQGTDTQVTVPDHVRRIAPGAFTSSKMTAVTVPQSVYAIDAYAFADCVGLKTAELTDGLVIIGDGAFRGCKNLQRLETPATLAYIGQFAFNGDAALESAALCGKELKVSYYAFKSCSGLQYALLSEGVASVSADAFNSCTALEGVSISPKVQDISASALSGCSKVTVCCQKDSKAQSALSSHSINTVIGDSDADRELTIIDATTIQYFLARMKQLNGACAAAADFNFDAEIDILDVLLIQYDLAGMA